MLRTVIATRYVLPLREGGSLPAIVEADDCGIYVAKFRGAGQGVRALVAELVAGEIGRALGLAVPETFDPAARDSVSHEEASLTVWFDAFTQNVDRTPRNANLLVWHRRLYLIDHGAALYFHHNWETMADKIQSPFPAIANHVLLPWASQIEEFSVQARARLTRDVFVKILDLVPDEWLEADLVDGSAADRRSAYLDFFTRRLEASKIFEEEAIRAHAHVI